MTRTTPDPVFADAARAAVLHRVSRQRVAATRRRYRSELVAVTLVVATVVAVLLGTQQARLRTDGPAVSPAHTSAVATSSPSPSPSPSTTAPTSLIGPPAARIRTEAQIRRWASGTGATAVWTDQAVLITQCMARLGFLYDPIERSTADLRAGHSGMTAADEERWDAALNGPGTAGAYDWRTAGCDGLAVHETGQDGAS